MASYAPVALPPAKEPQYGLNRGLGGGFITNSHVDFSGVQLVNLN